MLQVCLTIGVSRCFLGNMCYVLGRDGYYALDLRVKALGSVGGADWKRTTYDASLAWYLRSGKTHSFTPVVELGYRYIDSRTNGLDNMGNFYGSFGLRF